VELKSLGGACKVLTKTLAETWLLLFSFFRLTPGFPSLAHLSSFTSLFSIPGIILRFGRSGVGVLAFFCLKGGGGAPQVGKKV